MRFTKNTPEISLISSQIQTFFAKEDLDRMSIETGFVSRESPLTGSKFVQLCISGYTKDGGLTSLTDLCTTGLEMDLQICQQSLNERFNEKGVALMRSIFTQALSLQFGDGSKFELSVLKKFSQIIVEDSTVIRLPEVLAHLFKGTGGDASKAAVKIDCIYDLLGGKCDMALRHGKDPDSSMEMPCQIEQGSLHLKDLGYYKLDGFEEIALSQAFYVSRLKSTTNIYLSKEKEASAVDLGALLKEMKTNQIKEMNVFVGSQKRLPSRLVIQKVPSKIAKEKQKKLKKISKKRGTKIAQKSLDLCHGNLFITNLEEQDWSGLEVMQLYKIRWQIEIIFKVWKSVLKIGTVRKMKAERLLCILYGQLIWALINMNIFHTMKVFFWNRYNKEISEIKVFKIIRRFHHHLINAIYQNCLNCYKKCLMKIFTATNLWGQKFCKKQNPYPLFHIIKK